MKNKTSDKSILDRSRLERDNLDPQRAVLIGVGKSGEPKTEYLDSLAELMELSDTAGAEVVGSLSQALDKMNPATLIGTGKVEEAKELVDETSANLVVIDHQLTGQQTVKLEKILQVPVIDRTQLILDIFAQRAKSHEGKIQVELAQMLDQLPRMVGAWMGSLSRQGGGIGTRGPGETALEMDRRRIRKRLEVIREQLKEVEKRRAQHRYARKRNQVPSFALMGYTNAGKSTLINRLTKSKIYAQDQLFATLDPTTRKIQLKEGQNAVITDTVGFIRRLPTKLIEAFKATLEESADADILLHIIDASSESMDRHIEVVEELTKEFGWEDKPMIYVFNKVDKMEPGQGPGLNRFPRVLVSAQTGQGMESLRAKMFEAIEELQTEAELYFPNEKRQKLYELSRDCSILKQEDSGTGLICKVKINPNLLIKWSSYIVKKQRID